MKTLHHPRLAGVTVDIADSEAKRWTAAGWLDKAPKAPAKTGARTRKPRARKAPKTGD